MILAPGQTLNGRYQIIRELAQGGFGATFLAEDLHLPEHPRCVVKQLKPQTAEPTALTTARRLFETEAQILHEIGKHDQIPQLFAYFEEQQEFYLVENYIEGQSLRDELRDKGKLSAREAVEMLKEILEILVFVHSNQVIHRDINPSNLIRRKTDGKLCLIDFGAVKRVTTQFAQPSGATVAIGTQGYLPSEQAQGRPQFGSDVYAAGMIGIEAITGLFPHLLPADPRTAEIQWRDSAEVDDELAHVLDKMVRHDFRERFFTAQDALAALNELGQEASNTVVLRPPTSMNTAVMQTQIPEMETASPLGVNPKDRTAMALVFGLGIAGLLSLGVSINLGQKWLAGRQAAVAGLEQAQLYQELGDAENALRSYQDVLDENENHQGALLGKAQMLQQLERYDEALATYDTLLQMNPNVWEAWWGRGQIFRDRKDYGQAIAALDKAIAIDPNNVEAWEAKAKIHLAQKDTANALYSLESLLKLDDRQAWAWYEKGWIQHSQGQYNEAIAAYDRAIKINNNDPNIWYQRGNSFFKLGNNREAKNSYNKTVRLKPNHAAAWYSLGISLENLKENRDAQGAFAKVTELEPQNDRAWYHLAWNAQQNNDRSTAIAAYRRTVQIKGDDRPSWRNLGNLLYAAGDYAGANEAYNRTLNLDGNDGDTWAKQGDTLVELERYEEAIAAYDRALQYKPNDPELIASKQEAQQLLAWEQEQIEIKDTAEELQEKTKEKTEELKEKTEELKESAEDIKSTIEDLLPGR
ncbi:MAG: tetratricopeptide repeat protein [Limnothrix sp. RL_2_0]|nr:tetratricopeptide repeat protein [Limnothrix sp. RL_2_0]